MPNSFAKFLSSILYTARMPRPKRTSKQKPAIVWFRQDLRRSDNPALSAAAATGAPVLPIYILDDDKAADWAMGEASRWWLHNSLQALDASLDGNLKFFRGDAGTIIKQLAADTNARGVFWNRCYEPWRVERDQQIEAKLAEQGIDVEVTNGSLLCEPENALKKDGTPYRVFTPYYRSTYAEGIPPREPSRASPIRSFASGVSGIALDELELMPAIPWYESIAEVWTPGEIGARRRLKRFLENGILDYKGGRDRPDQLHVSRLSPHLHFGEISPHQVWYAAKARIQNAVLKKNVDHFLSELGWREFSYYTLYHFPDLPTKNLQDKFDKFPWRSDAKSLTRWQSGRTGYPMVDAGMRELWQTGYMHNRVRMLVGSFLVKNLLLHWHHGEDWFWDTLVDADLANNSASWQWVAGSGNDAAPYFRIFNPVTQGEKFDPHGDYVRKYVPEISSLPDQYVHRPWEAPAKVLREAGVELGTTYPKPMVDLKESRERALTAFKSLSGSNR